MCRYQYRKLWWRPSQKDGLESAKKELDEIVGKTTAATSSNNSGGNFWLGFGSAPLMVFILKFEKLSIFPSISFSDFSKLFENSRHSTNSTISWVPWPVWNCPTWLASSNSSNSVTAPSKATFSITNSSALLLRKKLKYY